MSIWKATGRITVHVEPLAGGSLAYLAYYRLPEHSGVPLPNIPMKADYPPVLIEVNFPMELGRTETEAKRNLRQAAANSPLAQAIVQAVTYDSHGRVSNEARQEIEAYALALEHSLRDARMVNPATIRDFMDRVKEHAQALLEAIENEPSIAQMLLSLQDAPNIPLDPARYDKRRRECVAALRALAHNEAALRCFPKRKGRRTQATKAETVALAIMHRWWGYFGETPDFAMGSRFMRLAEPALRFHDIHRADTAQFLRETLAKQARLMPLNPATK